MTMSCFAGSLSIEGTIEEASLTGSLWLTLEAAGAPQAASERETPSAERIKYGLFLFICRKISFVVNY